MDHLDRNDWWFKPTLLLQLLRLTTQQDKKGQYILNKCRCDHSFLNFLNHHANPFADETGVFDDQKSILASQPSIRVDQ